MRVTGIGSIPSSQFIGVEPGPTQHSSPSDLRHPASLPSTRAGAAEAQAPMAAATAAA
jgi:hypothetical protein